MQTLSQLVCLQEIWIQNLVYIYDDPGPDDPKSPKVRSASLRSLRLDDRYGPLLYPIFSDGRIECIRLQSCQIVASERFFPRVKEICITVSSYCVRVSNLEMLTIFRAHPSQKYYTNRDTAAVFLFCY